MNAPAVQTLPGEKTFPCGSCGSRLVYAPGTTSLRCAHCGNTTTLPGSAEQVVERDLGQVLAEQVAAAPTLERKQVRCTGCGAQVALDPQRMSAACPWCGAAVPTGATSVRSQRPDAILPFTIDRTSAQQRLDEWVTSRWFAPAAFTTLTSPDRLRAVWLPAWTFSCDTVSMYAGERGDDYVVEVEEQVTRDTPEGRKTETVTRSEVRTAWSFASGMVFVSFRDVLVPAGRTLPRDLAAALEPWPVAKRQPFDEGFLAGTESEVAAVGPADAYTQAKQVMDEQIRSEVRSDIGGDRQRVEWVRTEHRQPTCTQTLLPVWSAGYRFQDRSYTVLINATTGEIQGSRPWSWGKIALTVLVVVASGAAVWWFTRDLGPAQHHRSYEVESPH